MSSQSIRFTAQSGEWNNGFLIELPTADFGNNELYLKGCETDSAVLTTDTVTYRLREASTSNVIQIGGVVEAASQNEVYLATCVYFEMEPMVPGLEELKDTLVKSKYPSVPEFEVPNALHIDRIYSSFQASAAEIDLVLKRQKSLLIGKKYRKLETAYVMRFFEILQANCILQDVNITDCPISRLVEYISDHEDEYTHEIAIGILENYSCEGKIQPEEVVRLFGGELLKAKKLWSEDELLAALNKLVGEFELSIEMLAVKRDCLIS